MIKAENLDDIVAMLEESFSNCIEQPSPRGNQSFAFDSERRKYRKMLMDAKIACYSTGVRDCRGDTKDLYKLVNTLMGTTSNNPLPNHTNDKDLADEFADFL